MAKLKYGLQKKMHKETNRIGSFELLYDADDDNIIIAVGLRKDVRHAELIARMKEVVNRSIDTIQSELDGKMKDEAITELNIENVIEFIALQKKKK